MAYLPKTWGVPNAEDARFFEVERSASVENEPPILCVGHGCLREDQNAFIRALNPLAAKMNFQSPSLAEVACEAESLRLVVERPWCKQAGFMNRESLKKQLRSAACLALPSLEDNCLMVLLEAMAAGVPVGRGQVGGVVDLVEERETAIICDPLDAASMRAAIENVLGNGVAARQMMLKAKQRALERFHPQGVA